MDAVHPGRRRRSPQLLHALLEAPRALGEALSLVPSLPVLLSTRRGDGHPVLVLPGYLADDGSTRILRTYLGERGYAARGWRLGRNLGPRRDLERLLLERVAGLHHRLGRRVSLVGWSLGGVFAREVARARPESVRQVISLGSPFHRLSLDAAHPDPLPVPTTAIFSRSDGVVPWSSCRDEPGATCENIEVRGSHVGLGMNPAVLYAIADRLAQPEGAWSPFERSGLRGLVYPA